MTDVRDEIPPGLLDASSGSLVIGEDQNEALVQRGDANHEIAGGEPNATVDLEIDCLGIPVATYATDEFQ
jgi:hypothetical protein